MAINETYDGFDCLTGTKLEAGLEDGPSILYRGSFTYSKTAAGAISLESISVPGGMILVSGNTWNMYAHVTDRLGNTPGINPYAYCAGNPVKFVDPNGLSTWVYKNENGTYTVFGGNLEDDDLNVYVYTMDENGHYTIRGRSIGVTTSPSTFYNYDKNVWPEATIDLTNKKGKEFLLFVGYSNFPLAVYAFHALPGGLLDFKTTDGSFAVIYTNPNDIYRGMPIGYSKDGEMVISSARDIGNIAAGYEAGVHGLSWNETRFFFDGLQKIQDRNMRAIESISSQNAQKYGWKIGYKRRMNH